MKDLYEYEFNMRTGAYGYEQTDSINTSELCRIYSNSERIKKNDLLVSYWSRVKTVIIRVIFLFITHAIILAIRCYKMKKEKENNNKMNKTRNLKPFSFCWFIQMNFSVDGFELLLGLWTVCSWDEDRKMVGESLYESTSIMKEWIAFFCMFLYKDIMAKYRCVEFKRWPQVIYVLFLIV